MKQKHFIDSHKGVTPLFVLALMAYYDQWDNPTAWLYLATHGTYGPMWVLKSLSFPDKSWEEETGVGFAAVIWGSLSLYWIAPWIICSQAVHAPAWWLGMCAVLYAFGVFFHFASDMQKHTALKLRPGLITDGLWARCRNPNYFGELLIYLGFSLLPLGADDRGLLHAVPVAALALFIGAVWVPNMVRKDRSLSRYPEFAAYKAKSKLFIPFVI